MKKETHEWTVRMLIDFKERINVDAEYQRGAVWSPAQKALLIDSLMRGFDIPKVYLSKLPDGGEHLFNVIDGKQRLTAIWDFVSDGFPILEELGEFPILGNLGGSCWSELSSQAQDKLQFATITVTKIEDQTEQEVHELFLRLQQGEPLNAAEKRNAMLGPVRDFVANKLATASVWDHTKLRAARFGLHEHAAIALALVLENGPAGLKGADLYKLYSKKDFDVDGADAKRTVEMLSLLEKVAVCRPGSIRTRWGFVDLFICLMKLAQESRSMDPNKIMDFFQNFEEERRDIAATLTTEMQAKFIASSAAGSLPDDEIAVTDIPKDMLNYHLAFAREGANKENVGTRSRIMYKKLTHFLDRIL